MRKMEERGSVSSMKCEPCRVFWTPLAYFESVANDSTDPVVDMVDCRCARDSTGRPKELGDNVGAGVGDGANTMVDVGVPAAQTCIVQDNIQK